MSRAVIFGGAGYIGTMLARHFVEANRFNEVIIADIKPPASDVAGVRFVACDVRQPITITPGESAPEWIFNFAAVHREPGHEAHEYFDTNLAGARNICAWAEQVGCSNILFTSSIATYGPTHGPTTEQTPTYPRTPYGITKLCAELIHEGWQRRETSRRLVVVRPGVIYGPGDPGNILRMIQAVKRGYFFFPGSTAIRKSYGYIFGLIDSIEFMLARAEPSITYNYVEQVTEPIGELVRIVRRCLNSRAPVISMPLWLLAPAADGIQWLTRGRSPIHPVRVRKAATPTHIEPALLKTLGFNFRYDFARSLEHWRETRPEDFA
jgi:nucleoside-diphosphate-sugar epimerase